MDLANSPLSLDAQEVQGLLDSPLDLEECDDLAETIAALPPMSFVALARLLRDESRLDLLLPYARPEQLTSLLDLEVWERDRVDVARSRNWLRTLCDQRSEHPLSKRGALGDLIYEMDPELWTLSLCHLTAIGVVDLEDEQSRLDILDDFKALHTYETPDGYFVVGVPDNEFGREALAILQRVYEDDLAEGRKLVLSIHNALPSQIEEELFRWRSGRLADLGFPSREEAMRLFTPLTPAALLKPNSVVQAPIIPEVEGAKLDLVPSDQAPLLTKVMQALQGEDKSVYHRELLLLANGFLVALGLEPGHEPSQRLALRCVAATLNLGLEFVCAQQKQDQQTKMGVPELAAWLPQVGLRAIFRVGYGPLAKLRAAVHSLKKQSPVSGGGLFSLLDRPWGRCVQALGELFPMLMPLRGEQKASPIASLSQLASATTQLDQSGALIEICFGKQGLNVDPVWVARADDPNQLRLGDLLRSALIHRLRNQAQLPFAPLVAQDLAWAQERLVHSGRVHEDLQGYFNKVCEDCGAGAQSTAFSEHFLTRFAVELAALEMDDKGQPRLDRAGGFFTVHQVSVWIETGLPSISRDN